MTNFQCFSFAEVFTSQLNDSLKKNFNDIGDIWLTTGIPVAKRDEKIEAIRTKITEFVDQIAECEKKELEEIRNYNDFKFTEVNNILRDLTLPPFEWPRNRTQIAKSKIILEKYNELFEIKKMRFDKLQSITDKMDKVFYSLGMDSEEPVFATNIPSDLELRNLRTKLADLEQTLKNRQAHFESVKSLIHKICFEVEYQLDDINEVMIFNANKENFIYSQTNMDLLMVFHTKLIKEFTDYEMEITKLTAHLTQLFDRLEISQQERQQFAENLFGTFPQKKQILEVEIEKYEIIKKNSMEKIIKNIRKEIDVLLNECMVSKFDQFLLESEDYTEQLLNQTEFAYENLKNFAEAYKVVFQKLREWEDSLAKFVELEKKSVDPNRFNNRGGVLLQNERDRKMLSKKLPRLDKEIRALITSIEENNNLLFNSYGLDISDYFDSNWQHISESKDDVLRNLSKKFTPSAKKSATKVREAVKTRMPFSPSRAANQLRKNMGVPKFTKNLDGDMKKTLDVHLEMQFQVSACLLKA